MGKVIWWLIAILGVGLFGLIIYKALPSRNPEPIVRSPPPAIARSPVPVEPEMRHPIAPIQQDKPLPALDVSDATLENALVELLSDNALLNLFQLRDIVRRIVATIDNLPRSKVALHLMPVKPAPGGFRVTGKNGDFAIAPDNAERYAVYLRLANAMDAKKLVALYTHFYPLFQQAYRELGYPKGYFNDRLIEVIDDLLATPDVRAPVPLKQPKVLYLFADPELEALSAGQKLLIRTGSESGALIKTKLRDLRSELTHQRPAGSSTPVLR